MLNFVLRNACEVSGPTERGAEMVPGRTVNRAQTLESTSVVYICSKYDQDLQKEVLKWYLDALSIEHKPLNQLQWSTYAANMIR
ncbi:unnamed protein product [Haemonchus placei]|uniref:TIR domain-containing protein n=1 Tax=Haemonchus placei TaxID=6290 RepID=A0A0N4XBS3_HAEPC|nr:unnamed protein product [Haemonchus placei]